MISIRREGKIEAVAVAFHPKIEAQKLTELNGKEERVIAVLEAKVEIEIQDLAKEVTKEAEGARRDPRDAVGA